ncbi:MAG TPA: gluconate 2-dehydrogenase subunit 3 family protein [Blastocatellia bacterium]|nr:gluconate 2-dehydrogenase subunit 3 family protein [Blastocatellia bacterium]
MSEERDDLTRREALKGIGAGVGVIASLPVLGTNVVAHDHGGHAAQKAKAAPKKKPEPLKFFTPEEYKTVDEMSERIIPTDDSSPGAKAAGVAAYIDLIVSVSPDMTKQNWREGLAAINKKSQSMFNKNFADATAEQQIVLLKEISRNERSPQTVEERFFRTVKNATIDGYYTSEIGIKQELKYKGNTYLKEFPGCTHPEHQA